MSSNNRIIVVAQYGQLNGPRGLVSNNYQEVKLDLIPPLAHRDKSYCEAQEKVILKILKNLQEFKSLQTSHANLTLLSLHSASDLTLARPRTFA